VRRGARPCARAAIEETGHPAQIRSDASPRIVAILREEEIAVDD
jgi:hypothetical protein